jgi:hypothetical protein
LKDIFKDNFLENTRNEHIDDYVLTNCDEQEVQQSESVLATSNNQIQVEETIHVPKNNDEIKCQNETEHDGALCESAMTVYPSATRRHGNFAGVHTLLRILLSSNSAVLINIITGVSPPHFDFVVYCVLCQC